MEAVLVAQAWHWVDPPAAVAEAGRILTNGGVLGLMWNLRTESAEFAVRLAELMGGSDQLRWAHTIRPVRRDRRSRQGTDTRWGGPVDCRLTDWSTWSPRVAT